VNIGFVATRLAGTDGVSLEAAKLAAILERMGHRVFYCAGELSDCAPEGRCIPELHFAHPAVRAIHDAAFGEERRESLDGLIRESAARLRPRIKGYLRDYAIDLLVVQNAVAIPMNIPLGVALRDVISETSIPAIAHHHDFYWERERFLGSGVEDILERCFPPDLPSVRHVVINTLAKAELHRRRGLESWVVPNVLDFESGPDLQTDRAVELRRSLGLGEDDVIILQPTRIVPRKGIEHAIELVSRLAPSMRPRNLRLLISHQAGDEGMNYLAELRSLARSRNVDLLAAGDRFVACRQEASTGIECFGLQDAYSCANLVTYPSRVEGFGNAFLETVFYRRPLMVNRYPVYVADIEPCGFDVVSINAVITAGTVEDVLRLLNDPKRAAEMTDHNYAVASQHFSYETARRCLEEILGSFDV
jgi:glycosyltransferase involved in cell wall biosynthesis